MQLSGILGFCGGKEVLLGFGSAKDLHDSSFADVLDESTGKGYQRRFNKTHSLDFRKYIQSQSSTTIPLTFNLRPEKSKFWELARKEENLAVLEIDPNNPKVLSQVDCQHRLGFIGDLEIYLAVMIYIGLSKTEEMSIFNTINAKSKGLSRSLTDFHDAQLIDNIEHEKPELAISIRLNHDSDSLWYQQLDLGGNRTSGMQRRASLRTMQKAVRRFIKETDALSFMSIDDAYDVIHSFWFAISVLLPIEWNNPRKHLLTKGIGVYALTSIAADIYNESNSIGASCNTSFIISRLEHFIENIDWGSSGQLKGLGGEAGVSAALSIIRTVRSKYNVVSVVNGQ